MTRATDVAVRLLRSFDVDRLKADLAVTDAFAWAEIDNYFGADKRHGGLWTGLSLRSQGGRWDSTHPGGPGLLPWNDTVLLEKTPYFREVLKSLECEVRSVRLSALQPGGKIAEHSDLVLSIEHGAVRLHIPIETSTDIVFTINGERLHWGEGEFWYGDFVCNHWVENPTNVRRVHIVLDAIVNDWLLGLFPPEFIESRRANIPMPPQPIAIADPERYTCRFVGQFGNLLPKHVTGQDTDVLMSEGFKNKIEATVEVDDGVLMLKVFGRPFSRLIPIGEDRFTLSGGHPALWLELGLEGGVVRRGHVKAKIRHQWATIPMEVV